MGALYDPLEQSTSHIFVPNKQPCITPHSMTDTSFCHIVATHTVTLGLHNDTGLHHCPFRLLLLNSLEGCEVAIPL